MFLVTLPQLAPNEMSCFSKKTITNLSKLKIVTHLKSLLSIWAIEASCWFLWRAFSFAPCLIPVFDDHNTLYSVTIINWVVGTSSCFSFHCGGQTLFVLQEFSLFLLFTTHSISINRFVCTYVFFPFHSSVLIPSFHL